MTKVITSDHGVQRYSHLNEKCRENCCLIGLPEGTMKESHFKTSAMTRE